MQLRSDYHQSFPQSAEIALDSCFFKDCSNISDGQCARTVIVLVSSEHGASWTNEMSGSSESFLLAIVEDFRDVKVLGTVGS